MTPLILREFSIAHAQKNISEMARLFRRYIPLLYAIAAYFACYVAVQAGKVTYIFGGEQFGAALLPVTIMAFYPIHQTYGQLSGSVFYATGQTKLYRNIGIFFQVMGLPILYLLLAPQNKIGLDAGATGLALKMVGVQFIGVNVQLYYNARLLGLKYKKYLAHQFISLGTLLLFALLSAYGLDYLFSEWSIIFRFIVSGFMYTILVIGLILLYPIVFGLKNDDVHMLMAKISSR
jgi:O-antigen/teichoic acid export membrane protein